MVARAAPIRRITLAVMVPVRGSRDVGGCVGSGCVVIGSTSGIIPSTS